MDFDLLQEQIMLRLYRSNAMTGKDAEDYAAIAVDEVKAFLRVSAADVVAPVPNQAMRDFSAQAELRKYEHSDTFAHLFSETGEAL